ncbi:MAG: AmmeMemoRadiSam system protein B [Elusimicrobia bacterium]|nr:AmmeMemoRadiSam system protein B [Candidatus Liberimonas magnetica]
MFRKAICSGTWYPNEAGEINNFFNPKAKKTKIIAGICPHAGWIYSGQTAGEVYSRMKPSQVYILLGPNHTGLGSPVSLYASGAWETPIGNIEVDSLLAKTILTASEIIQSDFLAHKGEHSLEVQLPFIKTLNRDAKIIPISMSDYNPDICKTVGETIAGVLIDRELTAKVTLIASSDMSHYISGDRAKKLDSMAIDKILQLDPEGLLETVNANNISMCGSGPVAAVLWASLKLGAKKAELVRYSNSGDVTGDQKQVVGYAGMIII